MSRVLELLEQIHAKEKQVDDIKLEISNLQNELVRVCMNELRFDECNKIVK